MRLIGVGQLSWKRVSTRASFNDFYVMNKTSGFHIEVFWVVTPSGPVGGGSDSCDSVLS
jgi:hypothetical protein